MKIRAADTGRDRPARPADHGARPARPADHGARPARPADHGARFDNVGAPHDDEDDEIQDTIDRLSRDIDDGMRSRAFKGGGGDSLDDEGDDPQDDLMESAYWSGRVAATDV